MESITKKCFVCQTDTNTDNSELNLDVNLPVCKSCKGTQMEKEKVLELLDSLADGFVCGCI